MFDGIVLKFFFMLFKAKPQPRVLDCRTWEEQAINNICINPN